ncbi:MAG: DDE-type integrase/transposase/recombinase [Clostridia bacterium]|nr:DDE-type integrase/transposase/recombinase [Clostridia bacterium]
MNDKISLVGKIVSNGTGKYRVLHFTNDAFVLCETEISSINIFLYSAKLLFCQIETEEMLIVPEKNSKIVQVESFTETQKAKFFFKKEIVDRIVTEYGPLFLDLTNKKPKPVVKELIDQYHITQPTIWRYIRHYLQSGFAPSSLLDNRTLCQKNTRREKLVYKKKTGRPTGENMQTGIILTPEIYDQFDKAINQFKKGNAKSLAAAYRWLIVSYYTKFSPGGECILPAISEIPTLRQFYYYCSKHLPKTERDIAKLGKAEQRNAKRLLIGNSRADAIRPGWIVEVDAVEADVSLVSSIHPDQCIGRTTVYMMVDLFSGAIVSFSVGLEQNSALGIMNLLLNLSLDKIQYCSKYDITINEAHWPSNFIPHEIRCDRGSEFTGKHFANFCHINGIKLTLEPGATGSMKGMVEQKFHQFQTQLHPHVTHAGLITKDYNSNHHRESTLTLTDFTKLVLTFVLTHNAGVILDYPMTKEMLQIPDFQAIPTELWKYGCEKHGYPTLITSANLPQFMTSLMEKKNAKISRRGVKFQGLYYYAPNDLDLNRQMYDCGNKRKSFEILLDPRSMEKIYYIHENKLLSIPLNPNHPNQLEFGNMTYDQYLEYKKEQNDRKREGKRHNEMIAIARYAANQSTVDSAKKASLSDTDHIQDARRAEKQVSRQQNKLDQALLPQERALFEETPKSITENSTSTQHDPLEVPDDLKDAYKNFMNNEAKKHDL